MEKKEVLSNFKYIHRCLQLIKIDSPTSKKSIANKTNDLINNIDLINLLKFLKENDFIEIDDSRIPYIYKINTKKLSYFLRQSPFFKDWGFVIEKTKIGYNY